MATSANPPDLGRCTATAVPFPSSLCLYGLRDDASVETCSEEPGITGYDYGYIENHGLELIQPGYYVDPLGLMIEFIQVSLNGDSNEE